MKVVASLAGAAAIAVAAAAAAAAAGVNAQEVFNPLRHLGGNGQWFPGPNVFGIDPEAPEGCVVDQAAFVSRHGSRYPDTGAYAEWTALEAKIKSTPFTTNATALRFLSTWTPVLSDPSSQIAQLSPTGHRELLAMGASFRAAYPSLFPASPNYSNSTDPLFTLWANAYASSPRVLNSAQLFARGYLTGGPNSSSTTPPPLPPRADILVVNASDPRALANSLATSNLCPAYADNGGGAAKAAWDAAYLPAATARINALLQRTDTNSSSSSSAGVFDEADVGIFAYLCGFETQIVGGGGGGAARSPWCGVLTEAEVRRYEYAQDLRYWYGNGPGNAVARAAMLPVLAGLVQRFRDGPGSVYVDGEGKRWRPPPLVAAFTNDGQISQLAAALGVFDGEPDLPGERVVEERIYRASRFVTMRGTVGLERLRCRGGVFVRVKLNGAVYPVKGCEDGPGRSCGLEAYGDMLRGKLEAVGGFREVCNVTDTTVPEGEERTTFLWDRALPFVDVARP